MLVLQDKRGRAAALAGVLVTSWLFNRAARRSTPTDDERGGGSPSILTTVAAPAAGALIGAAAYALYPYLEMMAQRLSDPKKGA